MDELFPQITRYGRTYIASQSLYFNWTNAGFAFRFLGSKAEVTLRISAPRHPRIWLEITVDKQPSRAVSLDPQCPVLQLWKGERGEHTVTVRKRSEIGIGSVGITDLTVDGILLSPPPMLPTHIELIGDSLVCGHGNLAQDADAPFDTAYEDGTQTFGTLAAKQLQAECTVVGRSGLGLVANYDGKRQYTAYHTYLQTDIWDGISQEWDFSRYNYRACVISLGTNDWVAKVSPQEFVARAVAFIQLLRQTHPYAHIVWCYGLIENSMQSHILQAIQQSKDENISFLALQPITDKKLLGCGHPNLSVHQSVSHRLCEHLKRYW